MIAFATGFVLDQLLGDPECLPHPIRWIGKAIAFWEKQLLGRDAEKPERSPEVEKRKGLLLVILLLGSVVASTAVILGLAGRIHPAVGFLVEAILTFYLLAATSLKRESGKVYDRLQKKDLPGARKAVGRIVGRDTEELTEEGVIRATVETVAENLSDGVIAPMLYAAIGGPLLGMAYKAINTMDSMVGYRNERYRYFGTAAARLDDIANFIPARISALLLIAVSAWCGWDMHAGNAWKIWKRDRMRHASPNAGQTESACAGAMGIELGGDAFYGGVLHAKPTIGDALREVERDDILRANRLMTLSAFLWFLICLGVMGCLWISLQR